MSFFQTSTATFNNVQDPATELKKRCEELMLHFQKLEIAKKDKALFLQEYLHIESSSFNIHF